MTSPGLADFLLSRIAEDEAAARRAAFGYGANWTNETDDGEDWSAVHADGQRDMVGCEDRDVTAHIARHDPTRVLAECAAKRRIVNSRPAIGTPGACLHVVHDEVQRQREYVWMLLALAYSDHPDYDESWRP